MDDSAILSELGLDPDDEAFLTQLAASSQETTPAPATPQHQPQPQKQPQQQQQQQQQQHEHERDDVAEEFDRAWAQESGGLGGGDDDDDDAVGSPRAPELVAPAATSGPPTRREEDDDDLGELDDEFEDIPTMMLAAEGDEYALPAAPAPAVAFTDTRCKNIVSLVLFVAMSLTVVVLEMVDLSGTYVGKDRTVFIVVMSCFVSAAFGAVCLGLWIWIPQQLVWLVPVSSVVCVVFYLVTLLVYDVRGLYGLALVLALVAVALATWLVRATRRGQFLFAGVLLDMVSGLIKANPDVITVAAGVLLIQTLWLAIFAVAAFQSVNFNHFGTFYVLLAAVYYWTTQVFKHIVHVAVSGTVSAWYFRLGNRVRATGGAAAGADGGGGGGARSPSPTMEALRRACTTSFGSICFGSAFVAIVRWLWTPLRWAVESRWRPVRALFRRPYELVDYMHRRFNKYAFRQVVMYGKDFRAASMAAWEQFCSKGVDSIVAEDRVDLLLVVPCVGGCCLVAGLCGVWAYDSDLHPHLAAMTVISGLVGFVTVSLTTEVVEATLTAIYACFAEEPFPLSETHPLIFHRFVRISEFSPFQSNRLQDNL